MSKIVTDATTVTSDINTYAPIAANAVAAALATTGSKWAKIGTGIQAATAALELIPDPPVEAVAGLFNLVTSILLKIL